jgi:hypothetical protein
MTELLLALAVAATPQPWRDGPVEDVTVQAQVSAQPVSAQDASVRPEPMPVVATAPVSKAERRENIAIMEALLATAVINGARRVQSDNPRMALVQTDRPRARGFVLEGYGLFFDVEVPELSGSIEVSMLQLQRELARRTSQSVPIVEDLDPNAPYREAVIATVTNSMLDSKNLNVPPTEWLTVALRGSELPMAQMSLSDSRTVTLRIKGSDLSDYLASRISRDEAARRVEKREF